MEKFLIFVFSIAMMISVFSDFSLAYETPECDYGTFDAWYSKDGIEWQNTTVDHADLKRGEPFYIKATISTKIDSVWASILISETGEHSSEESSFEVIDGPCDIYKALDLGEIPKKNTSSTYVWKIRVKPDADWVGGNAPLNIDAQFDKKVNDEWYSDDISFTRLFRRGYLDVITEETVIFRVVTAFPSDAPSSFLISMFTGTSATQ